MPDNIEALLTEARDELSHVVTPKWRVDDQKQWIPFWQNDWRDVTTDEQKVERAEAIRDWEAGHGHDARLDCYPEYGCLAIEYGNDDMIRRLATALSAARAVIEEAKGWLGNEEFDPLVQVDLAIAALSKFPSGEEEKL